MTRLNVKESESIVYMYVRMQHDTPLLRAWKWFTYIKTECNAQMRDIKDHCEMFFVFNVNRLEDITQTLYSPR